MATVWQSVQLATATAALTGSTVEAPVCTIFRLMAKTVFPSWVFAAAATLSVLAPEPADVLDAVVDVAAVGEETRGIPPSANAHPPTPITAAATRAMAPVRAVSWR
jgi:hypothetical protein